MRQVDQELLWSSFRCDAEGVADCLKRGAHINILDEDGYCSAHFAAAKNATAVMEVLLSSRRKVNLDTLDKKGRRPLDWAKAQGHTAIVEMIESYNQGTFVPKVAVSARRPSAPS